MYRPRLFDGAFSMPRTQDPRNLPRVRFRKLDQYPTGLQATAMSQLCGDISFEVANNFLSTRPPVPVMEILVWGTMWGQHRFPGKVFGVVGVQDSDSAN